MIARLWHTRIDPARGADYDAFAATHSRAMFAALSGCLGVLFLGSGEVRSVLSLWEDRAAIDALDSSPRYRETVARFHATGILREPQTVELFDVTGGTVSAAALTAESGTAHRARARQLVHVNLPSRDLARSQGFYGAVFGWTFEPNTEGYVLFSDCGGIGGGLTTAAKPSPDGVLAFVRVEDIPHALARIEAAGGVIERPKSPVGGPGYHAVFRDPDGNRVGLFSDA